MTMTKSVLYLFWVLAALPALAQPTSDTTPPQLAAFSFTPSAVNVSSSQQIVTVNATVTDDLSGTTYGYAYFYSPRGQYVTAYLPRISGTPLSGDYRGTATIPRFVEAGVWTVRLYLYDSAGNRQYLDASALQSLGFPYTLTVADSLPDILPPTLLGASFSPSAVDVSSGNVDVTISLQVSDSMTGAALGTAFSSVGTFFAVAIAPPVTSSASARQYISSRDFHLVSGTAQNGFWQAVKTMPRYSPAGAWQIQSVTLYDAVGNYTYLYTAQLQAAGINPVFLVTSTPSDISPPSLTGIGFSPPLFNTSAGTQTLGITLSASDNLSGLDFSPTTTSISYIQASFRSPSGNQSVYVSPFTLPAVVGGTPLLGTWRWAATWPRYSEEGTWQLSYLSLKDSVSNQVSYTPAMLQAMGLPSSIVVTKPSLVTDGAVGPGGGTITDNSFGGRATITFPSGIAPTGTNVAIDVFASPLAVPTPQGFTMPGTYFVNVAFTPALPSPIPAPGLTIVLPLITPMVPGAHLSLYHIDPVTGQLAPAMNAFHMFVVGTVNADGLSATFLNVVTLSTVVAYLSNGSVLGDVDGNGAVNCLDVSLVKASFGKRAGKAGYNLAADFNKDGVVDVNDLFLVTRQLPVGMVCQ
jgi:hypothetical protein